MRKMGWWKQQVIKLRKQDQRADNQNPKPRTRLKNISALAASLWVKRSLPGRQARWLGTNKSGLGVLLQAQKASEMEPQG